MMGQWLVVGPERGTHPQEWIGSIAAYLVFTILGLMAGLMLLWPSCDVSFDSARAAATGLRFMFVSPGSGKAVGGDTVNIRGTGFTDGATVSFDGKAAEVKFVDSTWLTVRTPGHNAGRVDIVVTNLDKVVRLSLAAFSMLTLRCRRRSRQSVRSRLSPVRSTGGSWSHSRELDFLGSPR